MQQPTPARGLIEPQSVRLRLIIWTCVSVMLHTLVGTRSCAAPEYAADERPFELPVEVEFGLADGVPGGGDATQEPAPAAAPKQPVAKRQRVAQEPQKPQANTYAATPSQAPEPAAQQTPAAPDDAAAASGNGESLDAQGSGLGDGMGPGSGYAPAGATLALNVDLQRVRKTALVLETQALLDIIPEWQALLAGSGIAPMQDLDRVFVASPTLQRSNVVVAADHHLDHAQVTAAVKRLAVERGEPAALQQRGAYEVAAWRNRGPTERSIALTGAGQFTITRSSDLSRVLRVAHALTDLRHEQGFSSGELDAHGGFLAMEEHEAVALWVEGVSKYVRGQPDGVPASLRLSLFPVDQFHTELRVHAQYASASAAAEAMSAMDRLRIELSQHPRVTYLGLKSAIDRADLEQVGAALRLQVRLTLHQTRYLMRYVTRSLRPRGAKAALR